MNTTPMHTQNHFSQDRPSQGGLPQDRSSQDRPSQDRSSQDRSRKQSSTGGSLRDTLRDVMRSLHDELATIQEELDIIRIRKPQLEEREKRIAAAFTLLAAGEGAYTPERTAKPSTATHRFELSDEAVLAMATLIEKQGPVKSPVLYDLLVEKELLLPIDNEAPYRTFGRMLGSYPPSLLQRDDKTMRWTLATR